jgi:hypothetical protein
MTIIALILMAGRNGSKFGIKNGARKDFPRAAG